VHVPEQAPALLKPILEAACSSEPLAAMLIGKLYFSYSFYCLYLQGAPRATVGSMRRTTMT
jgi:hypothetical protein